MLQLERIYVVDCLSWLQVMLIPKTKMFKKGELPWGLCVSPCCLSFLLFYFYLFTTFSQIRRPVLAQTARVWPSGRPAHSDPPPTWPPPVVTLRPLRPWRRSRWSCSALTFGSASMISALKWSSPKQEGRPSQLPAPVRRDGQTGKILFAKCFIL